MAGLIVFIHTIFRRAAPEKGTRVPMTSFLVVDDSPTVRLTVRTWLESAGYPVAEAADGLLGLEALRSTTDPIVVLLDYQMPNMDGYEVLQRAHTEGRLPPMYAYVVISSMQHAFPPEFTDLLRQLAIQILPKPFDKDTLLYLASYLVARQDAQGTGARPTA